MDACNSSLEVFSKPVEFFYPGIYQDFKWPIHQWYNYGSPPYKQCKSEGWCDRYNDTYFRRWRLQAHSIVSKAHRLNARWQRELEGRWREFNPENRTPVLGLHLRGSDKKSNRKRIYPCRFEPFVADFFERFPTTGRVYIATESMTFAQHVSRYWKRRWGSHRVFVPALKTRTPRRTGNFELYNQLQVAGEVLMDIEMLARADYLLHGASAVAEAAIYLNPRLHFNSTHLEYEAACPQAPATCFDAPWRFDYRGYV